MLMIKKKLLVLALAIVSNFCIQAQQSAAYTSSLVDFQKALSLYNSKQYLAAQTLFNKIEDNARDLKKFKCNI